MNCNSSSSKLVILCGLPFAGKSTLGRAICERFGYREVNVDETKCDLYGLDIKDSDLDRQQWTRMYEETDKRIVTYLKGGNSVVDASRNFRKRERIHIRQLVNKTRIKIVTIHVSTPESLVRLRWARNRSKPTRHDVTDKDFEEIISIMEPPTSDEGALIFDYKDSVDDWLTKYAEIL